MRLSPRSDVSSLLAAAHAKKACAGSCSRIKRRGRVGRPVAKNLAGQEAMSDDPADCFSILANCQDSIHSIAAHGTGGPCHTHEGSVGGPHQS
jgi:hypothetical protein